MKSVPAFNYIRLIRQLYLVTAGNNNKLIMRHYLKHSDGSSYLIV